MVTQLARQMRKMEEEEAEGADGGDAPAGVIQVHHRPPWW